MNAKKNEACAIDPREWDFRGLNSGHAYAALRYELARDAPRVQEAVTLLTPDRRREIDRLTEAAWEGWAPKWIPSEGFWQFWDVFRACWCCGDFPAPWMSLSETQQARAVERCGGSLSPLSILTREELSRIESVEEMFAKAMKSLGQNQTSAMNVGSTRRYIVQIDWARGDDALLRPLLLGILRLRPEGVRPHKRHTGKRASCPMHKFKQLAAWRLATRASLNYKEAQQLVSQRKKEDPRSDHFDLLPSYWSHGAWKDAVDAGQNLLRRCG